MFLARRTHPVPPGLRLLNGFCRSVLRINAAVPYQVHFASRATGSIELGKGVWVSLALSGGCYLQGHNGLSIGDEPLLGPGVKMISADHDSSDRSMLLPCGPIRIGKRCWIDANAVILKGVVLGDDVTVGAGSVVTHSFPAGVAIAGVPARVISRSRPDDGEGEGTAE